MLQQPLQANTVLMTALKPPLQDRRQIPNQPKRFIRDDVSGQEHDRQLCQAFDCGVGSFGGWTICICLLCGGRESISINIVMWERSDFMAYTAQYFEGLIRHA